MNKNILIVAILILSITVCAQNNYKKYTSYIAFEQTKVLHKLLDYSEKLSDKTELKFHSKYYDIFYYLTNYQIITERYAFQINMLYYAEEELSKRKTKQQIINEVGIFIEKDKISKFANYAMKILKIVIDGTSIKNNTPVEVKNAIDSFKKEYNLLNQLK